MEEKREEIEKEIKSLLKKKEFHRGNSDYLATYQTAVTAVVSGLSKTEKEKYKTLAEKWTMETPPREKQIKYVCIQKIKADIDNINHRQADKQAGSVITNFIEDVNQDMGIKTVVLSAWVGPKNELRFS